MPTQPPPPPPDLAELVESWRLHLISEVQGREHGPRATPSTSAAGCSGARGTGHAGRTDPRGRAGSHCRLYSNAGSEPNTARLRLASLRASRRWLADEGELDTDPLVGLRPPKIDTKVTESLTDDQLAALIKACAGKTAGPPRRGDRAADARNRDARRRGRRHCTSPTWTWRAGWRRPARQGRQGPDRAVRAADRRRARPLPARPARPPAAPTAPRCGSATAARRFGYHGLQRRAQDRAKVAGINGFHPHLLRHTAATRWLAAGGSEGGLMAVAGWSTRDMLDRYTAATAADRAAAEARNLGLGEL